MTAVDSLREGNLGEALAQLQDQIRKDPADVKLRIFLFQLLSVMGQWDRALTQLNVSGEMDVSTLAMVQTYREALQCEVLRQEVFAGTKSPLIFGDPEQWIALLLEAVKLSAQGEHGKAAEIRDQAFEMAPMTSGSVNGEPFEWIADADSRLGPILEAIVNGRYYWIPFYRIANVVVEEPGDLRDRVWMPAYFTWANGGQTVGLIPNRYPGSESSDDGQVALGQKTDWLEVADETFLGMGQRMLATDAGEYGLMDIRTIDLDSEEEPSDQDAADQASGGQETEGSDG